MTKQDDLARRIRALRDEAASAGDTETVDDAERALSGDAEAIAACERILRAAEDMDDSGDAAEGGAL